MNIYLLCTTTTGLDTVRLLHDRIPIAGLIGLGPRAVNDALSGVTDLSQDASSLGMMFLPIETYNLSSPEDRRKLLQLEIDLLIVCGWQRLLPEWLIKHVRFGCVGAHGSPSGISGGRGRSPQNWALIAGADTFEISIFFIDPGIDSGPIIASRTFPVTAQDDISSSYLKVSLLVAEMIADAFESGTLFQQDARAQFGESAYLPQRLPGDGAIDWNRTAVEIARFIAALGRPYPGAFSDLNGTQVKFWRSRPLQVDVKMRGNPGQVVLDTASGALIVQTGGGLILIDDFDAGGVPVLRGVKFTSVNFRDQIAGIMRRHAASYPNLPIAAMVSDLMYSIEDTA